MSNRGGFGSRRCVSGDVALIAERTLSNWAASSPKAGQLRCQRRSGGTAASPCAGAAAAAPRLWAQSKRCPRASRRQSSTARQRWSGCKRALLTAGPSREPSTLRHARASTIDVLDPLRESSGCARKERSIHKSSSRRLDLARGAERMRRERVAMCSKTVQGECECAASWTATPLKKNLSCKAFR